jgi:hypothetical protein
MPDKMVDELRAPRADAFYSLRIAWLAAVVVVVMIVGIVMPRFSWIRWSEGRWSVATRNRGYMRAEGAECAAPRSIGGIHK